MSIGSYVTDMTKSTLTLKGHLQLRG